MKQGSARNSVSVEAHRSATIARPAERFNERGSPFSDFLPGALAVTEAPPARFAKLLIYIAAGFFAALLLWSALSPVDRVVTAQGKVRPEGQVQVINHPTGGTIAAIHVKAGDHVMKGQKLLSFDARTATEELRKVAVQHDTLLAEIARIEAEAEGRDAPSFPADLSATSPEVAATQLALFKERASSYQQQQLALRSTIKQRASDITQYEARVKNARRGLTLAEQQERGVMALEAKGYYPKLRALQVQRDVTSLRSELEQSEAMLTKAKSALAEAEAKLAQFERDRQSEAFDKLTEKRARAAQTSATIAQLRDQLHNLDLTAPLAGFVEKIQVATIGQTVTPGQEIMQLVPGDRAFVLDVSVMNRDIGFIREGMPVTLKFQAYDYQRYGVLNGTVTAIATDSTPSEGNGDFFYTVQVRPTAISPDRAADLIIHSGMIADADFHVGTRTVLTYFLDAITRERDLAFVQ
jgi:adhesin transport system membrane fusion protein